MDAKKIGVFALFSSFLSIMVFAFPVFGKTVKPRVVRAIRMGPLKGVLRKVDVRRLTPIPPGKLPNFKRREFIELKRKIRRRRTPHYDPVVQRKAPQLLMPSPIITFNGLDLNNWGAGWPPDTNGDVGRSNVGSNNTGYYIQTVNTSIGIFDKSTGTLVAAFTFDDFFDGTGTPCDDSNYGDPVVLYDRYIDRWIITDFAWTDQNNGPHYQCIAMSMSNDPVNGGWYQWGINFEDNDGNSNSSVLNDYPKVGVWEDGYYFTFNDFKAVFLGQWFLGWSFIGVTVWGVDKNQLANGTFSGQVAFLDNSNDPYAWALLPANAKSPTPPSSGEPEYLVTFGDDSNSNISTDSIAIYKVDFDFAGGSGTVTGPTIVNVASFDSDQGAIPQQGTSQTLDSLSDRPMYSAFYWNYGDHETIVFNHTVDTDGNDHAGIRWYELRDPGGTPTIYQQGTYAPDSNHRWMGSAACDANGNIAIGFSISSSSMYPSIYYAGRLASDPLGQLSQGEAVMQNGSGSQTEYNGNGISRWGDYSMLTIDPDDNVTFWYTTEYYETTGYDWQTKIGAFRFGPVDNPPTVSFVYPTDGGHVYGVIRVRAHGEDDDGVNSIEFYLDDALQNTYDCAGASSCDAVWTWDSTTVATQAITDHVLKAVAYDTASQTGEQTITVHVHPGYGSHWGGTGDDYGNAIAIDGNGELLLVGTTDSVSYGGTDILLYRLNLNGTKEWHQHYGSSYNDYGQSVAVDSGNNVIIAGYVYDGAQEDIVVKKLNSGGVEQWSVTLGGSGDDAGYAVAVDSNDNIIVAGYSTTYTNGGYDAIYYKLNGSDGSVIVTKHFGGTDNDMAYGFALDSSDNVYLVGETSSYTYGGRDIALWKLDSAGARLYGMHYGGGDDDVGYDAVVSGSYLYIVGTTLSYTYGDNDIVVYKINTSDGTKDQGRHFGGSLVDKGFGITTNTNGDIIMVGYSTSYTNGGEDIVVYSLNPDTILKNWGKHYGGSSDERAMSVVTDANGYIYVFGYTRSFTYGGYDFVLYRLSNTGIKVPIGNQN